MKTISVCMIVIACICMHDHFPKWAEILLGLCLSLHIFLELQQIQLNVSSTITCMLEHYTKDAAVCELNIIIKHCMI